MPSGGQPPRDLGGGVGGTGADLATSVADLAAGAGEADLAQAIATDLAQLGGNADGNWPESDGGGGRECRVTQIQTGGFPEFVGLGQLTANVRQDLVWLNWGEEPSATAVQVALGNGDGTFKKASDNPAGPYLRGVVIADFNGDHRNDLAIAEWGGSIDIFLGNGDGTFAAPKNTDVTGANDSVSPVVADFNHDGLLDIAVGSDGYDMLTVLLGKGDGTFTVQQPIHFGNGSEVPSIATADFNGDGIPDLVAAVAGGQATASGEPVLIGNGDGTFVKKDGFDLGGSNPFWVAVGDFNRDGKMDLAIRYSNGIGAIGIKLGNGDGTFQTPSVFDMTDVLGIVRVADFDGDGNLDLVASNNKSGVTYFRGWGDGTFGSPVTRVLIGHPVGLAVGDLDGDGVSDLVVGETDVPDVAVLRGPCDLP
jgi:hypothetical protein